MEYFREMTKINKQTKNRQGSLKQSVPSCMPILSQVGYESAIRGWINEFAPKTGPFVPLVQLTMH